MGLIISIICLTGICYGLYNLWRNNKVHKIHKRVLDEMRLYLTTKYDSKKFNKIMDKFCKGKYSYWRMLFSFKSLTKLEQEYRDYLGMGELK